MENKPQLLDLFCGCGGFSLGFEWAGFESVLAVDIWKDAVKTYNFNRGKEIAIEKDLRELDSDYIHDLQEKHTNIVGIIGGPPCQGYSIVGKREIDDERNFLYLEYFRMVSVINPKFFVIENVKGLLHMNGGLFVEDIYKRFGELGYRISHKLLRASDYGIPQKRERVFFVGIRNDISEEEFVFPKPLGTLVTTSDALSDLPSLDNRQTYEDTYEYPVEALNEYQAFMRKNSEYIHNHHHTNHSEKTVEIVSMVPDGGDIRDLPPEYWSVRKYNAAFKRMDSQLPAATVDTGHRNYFHYQENRIPTVRENCRIQSFPDDFIIQGPKTNQYKQVGNAVPPLLSYHIANEIKKHID